MGTIYMSEQSLDLLIQTVEMYRTGNFICKDKDIINKSFVDGLVYYSADKRGKEMADLQIFPSKGYVKSVVDSWEVDKKIWTVNNASEKQITLRHRLGSLETGKIYTAFVDGDEIGSYPADENGKIQFSHTGNFSDKTEIELVTQK
jgi:hypothetical protein